MSSQTDLPPASSPNLKLVHPTEAECYRIWKGTHPLWGWALTLPTYLDRETRLVNGSLAFNGGQIPWILVDGNLPPDQRPILSSCSTLRRPALVITKDDSVSEGMQHGVASVFTFEEVRGRGYSKRMMEELGKELRNQGEKQKGEALFSTLFSDIGKKFYNDVGWAPFESNHLQYPSLSSEVANNESVKPLFWDDLPALARRDEELFRKRLSPSPSKTRVGLIPNLDALHWHMLREEFMCSNIFNRSPIVRGAIYTPPNKPNSRIWATFARNFYGGIANPEKNVLYILRLVIEDETVSDEVLAEGLKAIVEVAQKEAKEYLCSRVDMWNPDERVRKLGERIEGAEYVVRESDSITSLQWFGDGSISDIEWVANEKYGWC